MPMIKQYREDRWATSRQQRFRHSSAGPAKLKVPVVALQDSVGARIQEGNKNVGFDSIFHRSHPGLGGGSPDLRHSGTLRRRSGLQLGLDGFHPHGSGKERHFSSPGPEVIKAVTHEEVTLEALGGAAVHSEKSGVCDLVAADETGAVAQIKELLSFLPEQLSREAAPSPSQGLSGRGDREAPGNHPARPQKIL